MVTENVEIGAGQQNVNIPPSTIDRNAGANINPEYVRCYSHSSLYCDETSTFSVTLNDGSTLPSFMVYDATNKQV